tara:strand:+ start:57 stop:272 length:216 start_codon:yes stop_codon:yes gene_type:complete
MRSDIKTIIREPFIDLGIKSNSQIDDYYTTYKGDPRKGIPTVVSKLIKKHKLYFENWHLIGGFGKSFLLYK